MIYQNGDIYEGEFTYGKKDGFGKFIDSEGKIYDIEYLNDSIVEKNIIYQEEYAKEKNILKKRF